MKFSLQGCEKLGNETERNVLGLQNPLIFFSFLIMGAALLPMASTRKELALLGGTFLFGYGALEMVLRMGGYWVTFLQRRLIKQKNCVSVAETANKASDGKHQYAQTSLS